MSLTNGVITLLPAPEGYEVDFDHPQRHLGLALFLIYGIGVFLSLLFLCQHLYVRWYLERRWTEPATICLVASSLLSLTMESMVVAWWAAKMVDVHAWEMPLTQFEYFLKSFTIVASLFNPVHALSKLSILLYYRNLSPLLWWKWEIRLAMFLVVGYCTSLFFSLLFACNPVEKAWKVTMTEGSCVDRQAIWLSTSILGFVSDFILLSLPVSLVVKLRMGRTQKIGVVFLFVVGSATFVTSIIRLYYLMQPTFSSPDQTWDMMPTILWAVVELNLLIICPSMFTLRQFGLKIGPSLFNTSSSKKSYTNTPKSIRTFGQSSTPRGRFNKYGILIDEQSRTEFDLTTLGCASPTHVTINGQRGMRASSPRERRNASPTSEDTDAHDRTWDGRTDQEWGPQRAILQTRTVSVHESLRGGQH